MRSAVGRADLVRARAMRSAVGRADLVRILALPEEQLTGAAKGLGFDLRSEPVRAPEAARPEAAPQAEAAPRGPVRSVPFWRLETMTFTEQANMPAVAVEVEAKEGLSEKDLESPGCGVFATPRAAPLAPWSALWPALRKALQTSAPGREVDVRRLVRVWGRGEVLASLPRRERLAWADRATLWIDRSPRLLPFWSDQERVRCALAKVFGKRALDVRYFEGDAPRPRTRLDPETPLLALSDLGAFGSNEDQQTWHVAARRLSAVHVRVSALVPLTRAHVGAGVAKAWGAIPWDSARSAEARPGDGENRPADVRGASLLLALASMALLVQPGLLRALRRLLPPWDANAATEAEVWSHEDVEQADATGLVLRKEAADRHRKVFAALKDAALRQRVRDAIFEWHQTLPQELLHAETLLWHAVCPDLPPPGELEQAKGFFSRLAATLESPKGARRPGIDLRRYGKHIVSTLPREARDSVPVLAKVWALATKDSENAEVPEGMRPPADGDPQWWSVRQIGNHLTFAPSPNAVWPSEDRGPGSPVAWLLAAGPRLFVRRGEGGPERQILLRDGLTVVLEPQQKLSFRTGLCAIEIGCWEKEEWAVAAGRDRFGLWAEAEVNGVLGRGGAGDRSPKRTESVKVRFRWIPPGRFRMGSPDDEAGRFEWEGPQHWVTWTEGRWLCDTPVTQALWEVVIGNNPSRFKSPDRPVEQVSWNECVAFAKKLNGLVPGLHVGLPSEAEWEHACRAGTETATWVGDLEILGQNNAPVLDAIAWYGGNCGRDFELKDGYDLSWGEKQYDDKKGGTHPVKKKLPNPFGLFDMLGNVFEWCLDGNGGDAIYSLQGYPPGDVENPTPMELGSLRVYRGGSWHCLARLVRAARRGAYSPDYRFVSLGFRLARGQTSQSARSAVQDVAAERRAEGRGAAREPGRGTRGKK